MEHLNRFHIAGRAGSKTRRAGRLTFPRRMVAFWRTAAENGGRQRVKIPDIPDIID